MRFFTRFRESPPMRDARVYLSDSLIVTYAVHTVTPNMPFMMVRISNKTIFLFIPFLYLFVILGGLGLGASSLFIIGSIFIVFKGTDYSLFAASKDVMYHPLLSLQKFGAKFITDMFVYRASKALIAFVFAQFLNLEMQFLSGLQFFFLTLWILLVFMLFKEQKKLNH